MRLSSLTQALPAVLGQTGDDVEIYGIVADSRQAHAGALFVAISGVNVDGHRFVSRAIADGVVAVVGERDRQDMPDLPWGTFTYVRVPDAREAWGWLCAVWHGFPSRQLITIGVTGTDGKTTTVNLIHAILRSAGLCAGMISTVSARIGDEEVDTGLHTTTPDPPDIQRYLAGMRELGATHAVLEVTSHGLAQRRVAGCDFDVAAVTNITHEHLDFHGSLGAYQQAKASLFEGLASSFRKPGVLKTAVLNGDDESFEYLRPISVDRCYAYATTKEADLTANDISFGPDLTTFTLSSPIGRVGIESALVGAFNVSNILAAASVAVALGVGLDAIRDGVAAVRSIPGRLERVDEGQSFLAIVDFAHTPNALEMVLTTLREMLQVDGRLILIFGCAGLRDRAKRSMMGAIAGRLSDQVIITAEDPRTESLEEIMAESAAAARGEGKREGVDLWCAPDRGSAMLVACQMARPGDAVIACGKGHEQSMCFGTVEYPWDDREAMRRALRGETLNTLPTATLAKE